MLTAVIDTNIIINSLLNGSCRPILEAFIEKQFSLAISEALIGEILEVCLRPKFRNKICKDDRERLLVIIKEAAKIVKPKIKINDCRDKDDNIIKDVLLKTGGKMVKIFKTKEGLISFLEHKYPRKISSIKLISSPFGFFILKEGLTLTDALAKLLPLSPKTPWKEEEYIKGIVQR